MNIISSNNLETFVTFTEIIRIIYDVYKWFRRNLTLQLYTAFITLYLQDITAITLFLINIFIIPKLVLIK